MEGQSATDPITVFASVTDASGIPVPGLNTANFTVSLNGNQITPSSVVPVPGDVSVVFAMDYSGSVTQSVLAPMQNAVNAFINAMQPGDKAAIVKFNASNVDKASVVQAFTDDKAALNTALMAPYPDPGSGTNIFDALILSVQQFAPPTQLAAGPKAIVLFSDGEDNASTASINDVIAAATQAGIPIFTVNISPYPNGLAPRRSRILLRRPAQRTTLHPMPPSQHGLHFH